MHSENAATARERTDYPRFRTKPVITGNMVKAGRALAGISQLALAKAAGIPTQTISRMEASGAQPIVSRDSTTVAVLAALGRHGVMLQPRGVALVQESKNPASGASDAGFANAPQVRPLQAPIGS
jgi:hypothetical protein